MKYLPLYIHMYAFFTPSRISSFQIVPNIELLLKTLFLSLGHTTVGTKGVDIVAGEFFRFCCLPVELQVCSLSQMRTWYSSSCNLSCNSCWRQRDCSFCQVILRIWRYINGNGCIKILQNLRHLLLQNYFNHFVYTNYLSIY